MSEEMHNLWRKNVIVFKYNYVILCLSGHLSYGTSEEDIAI